MEDIIAIRFEDGSILGTLCPTTRVVRARAHHLYSAYPDRARAETLVSMKLEGRPGGLPGFDRSTGWPVNYKSGSPRAWTYIAELLRFMEFDPHTGYAHSLWMFELMPERGDPGDMNHWHYLGTATACEWVRVDLDNMKRFPEGGE